MQVMQNPSEVWLRRSRWWSRWIAATSIWILDRFRTVCAQGYCPYEGVVRIGVLGQCVPMDVAPTIATTGGPLQNSGFRAALTVHWEITVLTAGGNPGGVGQGHHP